MTYTVHIRPRKDGPPFEIPQRAVAGGDVSLDFSDKPVAERFNTAEEAKAAADEVLDRIKDVVDRITKVEVAGFKSVYRCRILGWALMLIGAVVFLAFVPCAIFLYYHHNDRPVLSLALGGAWTVGVPIYFYIEHEFFFFILVTLPSTSDLSGSKTWQRRSGRVLSPSLVRYLRSNWHN